MTPPEHTQRKERLEEDFMNRFEDRDCSKMQLSTLSTPQITELSL